MSEQKRKEFEDALVLKARNTFIKMSNMTRTEIIAHMKLSDIYQISEVVWNAAVRKCAETANVEEDFSFTQGPICYVSKRSILQNLIP